jgi:hypothetical protein
LPKAFQLQKGICLDNGKTKERFKTKMEEADPNLKQIVLLISRYPIGSTKIFIGGNDIYQKRIYLTKELKVVAI